MRVRPGCGDRVVAQPLPQRLVHQRGDVVGEREQDRVAGHGRELAVEEAVGGVPGGDVHRLGLHRGEQLLGRLVALGAGGGEPGDGGLELRARLEHGRRAGVVRRPSDGGSPTTNVPAPWRVSTTPCSCSEASASRTDARLTSSVRARSRSDGSRSPGASTPGADVVGQALGDLLVALERAEGSGSFRGHHGDQVVWRQYHATDRHDKVMRVLRRVGVLVVTVLVAVALGHVF